MNVLVKVNPPYPFVAYNLHNNAHVFSDIYFAINQVSINSCNC